MAATFAPCPFDQSSDLGIFPSLKDPTTPVEIEIGIDAGAVGSRSALLFGHGRPETYLDLWNATPCSAGIPPSFQPPSADLAPMDARQERTSGEVRRTVGIGGAERRGAQQMRPALAEAPEAIAGDDDAFAAILAGQARPLASYARRLTSSNADAEDLVQDTMLRCWSARHRFRLGSNFLAWAKTIMRNRFLSGRRRARFQADLPEEAFDRLLVVASTQEQALELRDAEQAIADLSLDQRAAVLLASQGMTVEEAAAQLGIAEGTFKSRVSRARARLKQLIEDCNIQPSSLKSAPPPRSELQRRGRGNLKGVTIG